MIPECEKAAAHRILGRRELLGQVDVVGEGGHLEAVDGVAEEAVAAGVSTPGWVVHQGVQQKAGKLAI